MHVIHVAVMGRGTGSYKFTRLGRRHKYPILVHGKGRPGDIELTAPALLLSGFWPPSCIQWQELASNIKTVVIATIEMLHILTSVTRAFENWQRREA